MVVDLLLFLLEQCPKAFTYAYLANRYKLQEGGAQISRYVRCRDDLGLVVMDRSKSTVTDMPDIIKQPPTT